MEPLVKAEILIEALPYIKKFSGKTVVIKYGGHAMVDEKLKNLLMQDIILMKFVGMHPVIVHGGGPEINHWLEKTGQTSEFINGLRVTDHSVMEIAQMVLVGKINKEIVGLIHKNGGRALGLSGIDGGLIEATKKVIIKNGQKIDLGFVGEIEKINPQLIKNSLEQGLIPVISPIGCGVEGEAYNINADTVAGSVAAALGADKLILLTDVEGVLDKDKSLITCLTLSEAQSKIEKDIIIGGMIPKVECCMEAILGGVSNVHIINGRLPHALLLEIFTDKGVGTMVTKE